MASIGVESWIWYGVVTSMVILRYVSRWILFQDVRKFQIEDWFMLFIWVLYTILIEFLNICATVNTNLIDPTDIPTLTPQDITDRVYGSKCVLVVESMMCAVQWGTKACLLMLYWRLTENLREALLVKITSAYVAITYIVMMALYYGYWCRPFRGFWETPTPDVQCATQIHHLIVNLTFNLTSDILILLVPLPLFMRANLTTKKKLLLLFPFSLGFFTIICAILSKHLSFTQPFSGEWVFWYCREASTAMIVANMPYGWTIIRRVFKVKSFLKKGSSTEADAQSTQRHLSGVEVTSSSPDRRGSIPFSSTSKSNRLSSLFPGRHGHAERIPSVAEVRPAYNLDAMKRDFNMQPSPVETHDKHNQFKDLPSSSSSSEMSATKMAERKHSVSDVDKLYRLDDETLEMTDMKHHSLRDYEPHAS